MFTEVAVIVPALGRNRYSPLGDLVPFSGLTLLEWKLTQLLKVVRKEDIYVATPSQKVVSVVRSYGVNIVPRKEGSDARDMIQRGAALVDREHLMWTSPTSPFIGPARYTDIIRAYLELDKRYDSIVAVLRMQEYFLYREVPVNFDIQIAQERREIGPVLKITNGCSIVPRAISQKYTKDFGLRPFYYELDKFASMEISEIDDDSILNDLVAHYFRRELDIVDRTPWRA